MTHDELLWAINSVVENGTCETVGHYSSAKALRAVAELHKPIFRGCNDDRCCGSSDTCGHCADEYPCDTIQAIEKELQ